MTASVHEAYILQHIGQMGFLFVFCAGFLWKATQVNKNKTTILISGLLVGFYIGIALWLIPKGTDDFRMVAVFSMDEVDIVTYVCNLVSTDFQTEPSFKYGGAFYYVPAGVLYGWSFFAPVTEQVIVIGVRLFCTLAGLGCLWVTYCLGREVFSPQAGFIGACLLGLSPEFLRWSVESHPDLPQVFFLLCGLFWICRYMNHVQPVWLALAGAGAGLAFGTKYAGIFMVPVLVFAVFGRGDEGSWQARFVDSKRWLHVGIIGGSFALAFALTNPFAIMDVSGFVKSLKAEGEIMRFGHRVREMSGAWDWLWMLVRYGPLHYVVLLGVSVWSLRGVNWRKIDRRWWVLILWVMGFMG